MKKLLLATLLTITASSSFAYTAEEEGLIQQLCMNSMKIATITMQIRQEGGSINIVLPKDVTPRSKRIAISAFSKPIESSNAAKAQVITQFGNDEYLYCLKQY